MKKWMSLMTLGAILGHLLASYVGPKVLKWYFAPPVTGWADCSPAVAWGMSRLILIQLLGLVMGCIVAALLGWKIFGFKTKDSANLSVMQ